jgi:hypothetical protein
MADSSAAQAAQQTGSADTKAKGLDRADQAAGEHGKHGRANAREKRNQ